MIKVLCMSVLTQLKVPCFKAGGMATVANEDYRLVVSGLVEMDQEYSLKDIKSWPKSSVSARLTSVSGFSVRALWEGVLWKDFTQIASPRSKARYAQFLSIGSGYSTTVSLVDLNHPRVLLVYAVEGEVLEREYGGPLRMVIPHLYGYKSAKWLGSIRFVESMEGGYWEDRGYSREAVIEPGTTRDMNTGITRPVRGGEITEF